MMACRHNVISYQEAEGYKLVCQTKGPTLPYTLSYRAFIAIDGRSVYVGITSENRLADRIHANVPVRGLESAESRARDGITVI